MEIGSGTVYILLVPFAEHFEQLNDEHESFTQVPSLSSLLYRHPERFTLFHVVQNIAPPALTPSGKHKSLVSHLESGQLKKHSHFLHPPYEQTIRLTATKRIVHLHNEHAGRWRWRLWFWCKQIAAVPPKASNTDHGAHLLGCVPRGPPNPPRG
ncbi:hypothetical protein CBL_11865 [Carabus blaptoides fortunei]